MNETIQLVAVLALPLVLALSLHEAGHAYVAKHFGDLTAYSQGRVTLNPIKHIDPLGTIVVPLALMLLTKGSFVFGWARPTPINPAALRNPRKHLPLVTLAGPVANFAMALAWAVLGLLLVASGVDEPFFSKVASAGVFVNILFFALNIMPIPPLDGGHALAEVLPPRYGNMLMRVAPYGFFIVIALLYTGVLWKLIAPVMAFSETVLGLLISPLSFLVN